MFQLHIVLQCVKILILWSLIILFFLQGCRIHQARVRMMDAMCYVCPSKFGRSQYFFWGDTNRQFFWKLNIYQLRPWGHCCLRCRCSCRSRCCHCEIRWSWCQFRHQSWHRIQHSRCSSHRRHDHLYPQHLGIEGFLRYMNSSNPVRDPAKKIKS